MPRVVRDGIGLYYEDRGSGDAVVLHTGGGGDGRMWARAGYDEALGAHRRVVLDHRGHGRSDVPGHLDAYRIEEHLDDVRAVLDAAGVERAAFVGYSAGASVGFALAAEHPDRVSALVSIGNVPEPPSDDARAERARVSAAGRRLREVGMRAAMEEIAAREDEPPPAWLLDNLAATSAETFALTLEAWADAPDPWALAPRVTVPTLLVVGEREVTPDEVGAARARLTGARAHVLPGWGHLQTFWHGEVTGPLIAGFLRDVLAR